MQAEEWIDPHGREGATISLTRRETLDLSISVGSALDLTGATVAGSIVGQDGTELVDLAPSLSGQIITVSVAINIDTGVYFGDIFATLSGGSVRLILPMKIKVAPARTEA